MHQYFYTRSSIAGTLNLFLGRTQFGHGKYRIISLRIIHTSARTDKVASSIPSSVNVLFPYYIVIKQDLIANLYRVFFTAL